VEYAALGFLGSFFQIPIDCLWVRALIVPINLGLIKLSFLPNNLISVQKSPVPLLKFQMNP